MEPLLPDDDRSSATSNGIDWIRSGLTITCGLLAGFLLGLTVDYLQVLFLPKLPPAPNEDTNGKTENCNAAKAMTSQKAVPLTRDFSHSDEPCKFCQSGFFTLRVGRGKQEFYVHKHMLKARSKYFERILAEDSEWQEAKDNQVTWQDEKVQVVSIWIDWLYGKPISMNENWSTMVECYSFSHHRLLTDFKNAVMDAIRQLHRENNWFTGPRMLIRIKDYGLMGTPLYTCSMRDMVEKLLVQPKEWKTDKLKIARQDLDEAMEDPELAKGVIASVLEYQISPWDIPHQLKGCHFHEHDNGEKCLAKKG